MGGSDKSGLFFKMFQITPESYSDLEKLAQVSGHIFQVRSAYGVRLKLMSQALDTEKSVIEKKLPNYTNKKKYDDGGRRALMDVFKQYKKKGFGKYYPHVEDVYFYIAVLSNKKLGDKFNFANDAKHVEMMMSVLTELYSDHVIHLGIQRNMTYGLAGHTEHPKISMQLHGSVADCIREKHPSVRLMVTNPLKKMKEIFEKTIPADNVYHVKDYSLSSLRKQLNIKNSPKIPIFIHCYGIESLLEPNGHTAVLLNILSQFALPCEEHKISKLPNSFFGKPLHDKQVKIRPTYPKVLKLSKKLNLVGAGFLIVGIIMARTGIFPNLAQCTIQVGLIVLVLGVSLLVAGKAAEKQQAHFPENPANTASEPNF